VDIKNLYKWLKRSGLNFCGNSHDLRKWLYGEKILKTFILFFLPIQNEKNANLMEARKEEDGQTSCCCFKITKDSP